MPVVKSPNQLFSRYGPSSMTSHPQGYIKICSLKESWKWDSLLPLTPLLHPHVHIKMVMVYWGVARGGAVQTLRPRQQIVHMLVEWGGSSRTEMQKQLGAITGAPVIRATVGGSVLSLQLSDSKWLRYDMRERRQKTLALPDRVWKEHEWTLRKVGQTGQSKLLSLCALFCHSCLSFVSRLHSYCKHV